MKKKQHGGARPGAGRPPGRSATSISISVPVAIKEKLDELPYGDRSALIVQFLKQYFEA